MDLTKTVITKSSTYITLSQAANKVNLNNCTVFELDSFTKYSIFKSPNDECLYAKNTHFGWMKCGDNLATDFEQRRIKMVEDNIGMEIMLNDIGHINHPTACNQKDL